MLTRVAFGANVPAYRSFCIVIFLKLKLRLIRHEIALDIVAQFRYYALGRRTLERERETDFQPMTLLYCAVLYCRAILRLDASGRALLLLYLFL
uniref:Uncharacterized protein n=1 Tax=Larimichthys crocea TaxID=215358 RepID=A0A0F8AB53_LARCR